MTVDEVVQKKVAAAVRNRQKPMKSPQDRRRERETDFEKNARELAAKKRALKPKSPI